MACEFRPTQGTSEETSSMGFVPIPSFSSMELYMLEFIGNTIGHFVTVEEDFMNSYDKRMAKILVEMDISVGLLADVEILCHEHLFSHHLDYLNIPFRCSCCRDVGHLHRECLVLRQGATSLSSQHSPLMRRSPPSILDVPTMRPSFPS